MTKAAIDHFLTNKRDQIFLVHLDGGDIPIGYKGGVQPTDLSTTTIGGSDLLVVKRTSKYMGDEIKMTMYHEVGTVFAIGITDDDSPQDLLPDPFTF